MKGVMCLLLALPLLLVLVALPGGAQACMGGDPAHTYFEQNMTVEAGNYSAKPFTVEKDEPHLYIEYKEHTAFYILSDAQMVNFQSGKEFTSEFNSTNRSKYDFQVNLTKGKYWAIVDNRASTTPITETVTVERPAMKCGDPAPIGTSPEFQGSQVIAALIIVAGVVVLVKRSRTK